MLLHLENLKQKFTEIGYSPQLTEIIGKTINKKKKGKTIFQPSQPLHTQHGPVLNTKYSISMLPQQVKIKNKLTGHGFS